jgi:hypothetical protein
MPGKRSSKVEICDSLSDASKTFGHAASLSSREEDILV